MRKRILAGVAAVAVVGAGWGGHWWFTAGRYLESTDDAYVQSDMSVISPRIQGYVRDIDVTDNQRVRQGEVLLRIEDTDFRARVADAQAAVAAQQAALASNVTKIELQSAMIDKARAQLASAQADRERAKSDFSRFQSLVSADFVSRQKFEQAKADFARQEAAVASTTAGLKAEQDQLAVLKATAKEIDARLAQAKAQLDVAQNDLDNTVIRAPIDGVVGNRSVRVGQFVRAGGQLLVVVPLPDVYVVANFKETQIADMRPGQKVSLTVDALDDRQLVGHVESFAPASGSQFSLLPPENATGNFTKVVQRIPVRIAVDPGSENAGLLRPGLSVVVTVDTRTAASPQQGPIVGAIESVRPRAVARR